MSAQIAVVMYLLFVPSILILLPFFKRFSEHPIADLVIRRACWVIAIYLLMMDTPIIADIAITAGIGAEHELMNIYLFLFGWVGYVFLGFFVLGTLWEVLKDWKVSNKKRRMGGQ